MEEAKNYTKTFNAYSTVLGRCLQNFASSDGLSQELYIGGNFATVIAPYLDLEIIKRESSKIQGLVQVLVNKIEKSGNDSDTYIEFLSASNSYLKDYSFYNEIDRISQLYSDDPHRTRNMRLSILAALEETKLIVRIAALLEVL